MNLYPATHDPSRQGWKGWWSQFLRRSVALTITTPFLANCDGGLREKADEGNSKRNTAHVGPGSNLLAAA